MKSVELPPALYLVATPIGNLRDMSYRAVDVLGAVDVVLCEDTRVSGKLMKAYGLKTPLKPYHDHSHEGERAGIIKELTSGRRIALISDAGTPLISDPGYKLVRDCLDIGVNVVPVPGANAPLTALQVSGLPSDQFSFLGFVPTKDKARHDFLAKWRDVRATLIMFERGSRLPATLEAVGEVLGARDVAVVRELTKLYEETRRGTPQTLIETYKAEGEPKGEIVLVVSGAQDKTYSEADIHGMLTEALKSHRVKDAANIVAEATGTSKRELYETALALKNDKS